MQCSLLRAFPKSFSHSGRRNRHSCHNIRPLTFWSLVYWTFQKSVHIETELTEVTVDVGNVLCCFIFIPTTSIKKYIHSAFYSVLFLLHNDPVCINLFKIVWIVVYIWNHNIQKCILESSPYFSCRTPFHLAVVYELSLIRCVSHMWNFGTRNNMTEWIFKYRSMSVELWSTDTWHINSLHSSCLTIYWFYTEKKL
jgi:hypothetical protein